MDIDCILTSLRSLLVHDPVAAFTTPDSVPGLHLVLVVAACRLNKITISDVFMIKFNSTYGHTHIPLRS